MSHRLLAVCRQCEVHVVVSAYPGRNLVREKRVVDSLGYSTLEKCSISSKS